MGPGATLDKRRPDLRDELGYIAPPNRKLPPVPGSNYNTCDRIKRGTVISKHLNFPKQHLLIPTTFSFLIISFRFTILNCIYVAEKASKDLCKQNIYSYTQTNILCTDIYANMKSLRLIKQHSEALAYLQSVRQQKIQKQTRQSSKFSIFIIN